MEDEPDGTTLDHAVTEELEAGEPTLCYTGVHQWSGKEDKAIGN